MKAEWFSLLAVVGFLGCARGLVEDAPADDTALRDSKDAATSSPPIGDASLPDTNEPLEAGADASEDAAPEAATEGGIVVTPPVVDGNIAAGEYGVHTNGQNQQASTAAPASTTWYMTWTQTHLYIGVAAANVAEGVLLYLDHTPIAPSNAGTNADGSLAGVLYDATRPSTLPFRADFVAYLKGGYNEYRTANGANGWSTPTAGAISVQTIGAAREIAIPWSIIRAGGRPSSFAWLGYAASAGGYVYGAMPPDNPGGNVGENASFGFFYKVIDATPGAGTKPFSVKLSP